jgi:hypothetical protein
MRPANSPLKNTGRLTPFVGLTCIFNGGRPGGRGGLERLARHLNLELFLI